MGNGHDLGVEGGAGQEASLEEATERPCGDWRSRAEENRSLSLPVLSWSSSHRLRAEERLGDPGDPRLFLPILPALHGLGLVKEHGVWGLGQTPALVSHWPALCPPQVRSTL